MNTGNRFVALFSTSVALLLLAACGAAQPTATVVPPTEPPAIPVDTPAVAADTNTGITLTFEGDQCVYHGPERVPAGQITVTLDVKDQSSGNAYAVSAYTLEEGKTIEDLRAWTSADSSPLWGHFHGRVDATGGKAQETTIILFEGPFFLSCATFPPNQVTDVLGPIEIEPAVSK
jgi:hypothetical protein